MGNGVIRNLKTSLTYNNMKKKNRKFPSDVARFFNPHKSGTNTRYNMRNGVIVGVIEYGTHQRELARQSSNIPVYSAGGTARNTKTHDRHGHAIYQQIAKPREI
jgi:hypothetical protein